MSIVERGKKLQEITESKWMDAIGVLLVLVISFALGFHKTVRQDLPIGIFSTFGAAASMMVTRLVTKRNNIGNLIGLLTAINSAFVDYYLGNDVFFGILMKNFKPLSSKINRKECDYGSLGDALCKSSTPYNYINLIYDYCKNVI